MNSLQQQLFDPKQINLPYTIAIIKPDTVIDIQLTKKIIKQIQQSQDLQINNIIQRQLYLQQAKNLFYKHKNKPYFNDIIQYMISGQTIVMVITAKLKQNNNQIKDPIKLWKKMIGNLDPQIAKKTQPNSYRAKYGKNLIKNQFGGSDNPQQANKQRKIFNFKIPQQPPIYLDNPNKITLKSLKQFLHPPNLQHVCINQRMDIMALYGPVVNWHSIQQCFCKTCKPIVRQMAQRVKLQTKKPVLKVLKQKHLRQIIQDLCQNCIQHIQQYSHIVGGRDMQHILTDLQLKNLAIQLNKKELIQYLQVQKGTTAKVIVQGMTIKQPKQIQYSMEHFQLLVNQLQKDYYQRYQFKHIQNLLLQDRRIRIRYWISTLTKKPIHYYPPITSLDNTLTNKQLSDINSIYYTSKRQIPLPLLIKPDLIKNTPINFNPTIIDKKKLYQIEQNLKIQKNLHRNLTKVVQVGTKNISTNIKQSVSLLRQYNQGRHGTWNNYATLKKYKGQVGGINMQNHIINQK